MYVFGNRHASVQSTNVPAVGEEVGNLLGFTVGAYCTGFLAGTAETKEKK